jgi:outer membrane protein assembly factor BamB
MARGDYTELTGTWEGASVAVASGDRIYIAANGLLCVLDPEADTYEQLPGEWTLRGLVPIGESFLGFDGGGALFRMERSGAWQGLDLTFEDLRVVVGAEDKAFAVGESLLYEVDLEGNSRVLEGSWNPACAGSVGKAVYFAQDDGDLFRLDPQTGGYQQLADIFLTPTAMTGHRDGHLYLISDAALYDIDPETGDYERLSEGWHVTHLVSCGRKLYAFATSGVVYAIEV